MQGVKFATEAVKKAANIGVGVAEVSEVATKVRDQVSHVVEDSVEAARKAVKRTKYAAEDMLDDAAYRIKREPIRSVSILFGIGFGLGALTGFLVGFRPRKNNAACCE